MKLYESSSEDVRDYRQGVRIVMKDEDFLETLEFIDGEPEDNNLARNFSDARRITELIVRAYEAGRAGRPLTHKNKGQVPWEAFCEDEAAE